MNIANHPYKINFKGASKTDSPYGPPDKKPMMDTVLEVTKKYDKKDEIPNLWNCGIFYPSMNIPIWAAFGLELGFLGVILKKQKQWKNNKSLTKAQIDNMKSKFGMRAVKVLVPACVGALAASFVLYKDGQKNREKNKTRLEKQVEDFNKINNMNVKLRVEPNTFGPAAAYTDPLSGYISVSKTYCYDPLFSRTHAKHFVNHELVHAKQYMMIARLDNGIEKLNFETLKKISKSLGWLGKLQIRVMYDEIQSGISDKYKNAVFPRNGYNINLVDYVTAMHTLLNNPNAKAADVPMIINKDYYQTSIKKLGRLSPKEKKIAEEYLQAYKEYPPKIGFFKAFNPNSSYRKNLLEKEAYKMNPWWTF